jgi:calcineurin-like phosphoesterase family protein
MSEIWFTSDTHFGHARIAEFCPTRVNEFGMADTSDIPTMNEAMVEQWNSQVAPEDTVVHLGDLAMGQIDNSLSYVSRLNGQIYLVSGNHDRVHPSYSRTPEKRARWHETYTAAGIHKIMLSWHWDFDGIPVVMSHFPYTGDHDENDRYPEWRPEDHGQVLVHGHVHDMWQINGRQVNVGMDAHGGRLLHETEVLAMVEMAAGR